MYGIWLYIDSGCVSIQFRENIGIPKEFFFNFEPKKNAQNSLSGNACDLWQHSSVKSHPKCKKFTPIDRFFGRGGGANRPLWVLGGPNPKCPLDPPVGAPDPHSSSGPNGRMPHTGRAMFDADPNAQKARYTRC